MRVLEGVVTAEEYCERLRREIAYRYPKRARFVSVIWCDDHWRVYGLDESGDLVYGELNVDNVSDNTVHFDGPEFEAFDMTLDFVDNAFRPKT